MDNFNIWNINRRTEFATVTGTITQISPFGSRGSNECSQFVTVEDDAGNITNFIVNPSTYIADFATLYHGMQAHFVYNTDRPAPAIFPPQFTAVAVVSTVSASNVAVGFFNQRLINTDNTLRLNLTGNVPVVTSNNQVFFGSPGGRYLIVLYEASTKSIPAITTPEKVVVMCEW